MLCLVDQEKVLLKQITEFRIWLITIKMRIKKEEQAEEISFNEDKEEK